MINEYNSILISVRSHFTKFIIDGSKTVELRKKIPSNLLGKSVYIYSTCPDSKIMGYFKVHNIVSLPLPELWNTVSSKACISKGDFYKYYLGKNTGFAIYFDEFVHLKKYISLKSIRRLEPNFFPPQNYLYLNKSNFFGIKLQ